MFHEAFPAISVGGASARGQMPGEMSYICVDRPRVTLAIDRLGQPTASSAPQRENFRPARRSRVSGQCEVAGGG